MTIEKITPLEFLEYCYKRNIRIERIENTILTIAKTFQPGSAKEYTNAESDCSIIYSVPTTEAGSIWGTDGLSIGGMVGMRDGYMRLNKSGCGKLWLKKLVKLISEIKEEPTN